MPMSKKDETQNGLPQDRILPGISLMTLAMFIIPIRDGIAKYMTSDLTVFVIAWGTYVAAALVAVPLALVFHGKEAVKPAGLPSQTARTLLLVGAMTLFFFSIRRTCEETFRNEIGSTLKLMLYFSLLF